MADGAHLPRCVIARGATVGPCLLYFFCSASVKDAASPREALRLALASTNTMSSKTWDGLATVRTEMSMMLSCHSPLRSRHDKLGIAFSSSATRPDARNSFARARRAALWMRTRPSPALQLPQGWLPFSPNARPQARLALGPVKGLSWHLVPGGGCQWPKCNRSWHRRMSFCSHPSAPGWGRSDQIVPHISPDCSAIRLCTNCDNEAH